MKARQIMTTNPIVLTPDASIALAAETMRYQNVGCIPVVRDAKRPVPVGLITARDIAVRCVARHHAGPCRVGDHMTPGPVRTAGMDTDASEIATMMRERKIRRVPVVSDDGVIVGIVSQCDLPNPAAANHTSTTSSTEPAAAEPRFIPDV